MRSGQKEQDLACRMVQIADPARSALFDVEHLECAPLIEPENFLKYLSRLSGGCTFEHKGNVGKLVCIQCAEAAEASKAASLEEGEEGTPELPIDVAKELHVFHQFTRGKASVSSQMNLADLGGSADAGPVPIVVKKPSHPYQLKWQVHIPGEVGAKGRAALKRTGLPNSYHPLGFMCDISKRDWLACASHVQYTQGSICFLSGLTLLKPWQVKHFLLTIDPEAASLMLKCGSSPGSVCAVKMYGKELRVAISAEDLRFIDKFRATMRDALLSSEKLGEAQLQKELHDFCARGEVLDDGKEGRWFQPFGTSDSLPGLHPLLQDTVADATADAEENVLAAMHMMAVKKKKVTARKLAKEIGWPETKLGPIEVFLGQRKHLFYKEGKNWRPA